jgi:hypothetical protein
VAGDDMNASAAPFRMRYAALKVGDGLAKL